MFTGKPLLVVRRTWTIRFLAVLIALAGLALGWIGSLGIGAPDADTGAVVALMAAAVALLGLTAYIWWREAGSVKNLHADGIESLVGSRRKELRWSDVTEVWFRATRVRAGGLVGALAGAAIDAMRKDKGLNQNNTSIRIRLVGKAGEKITLTSNDRDVVKAYELVLANVNPRLVESAWNLVQAGKTANFGKVSISRKGIARGNKDPVPFNDCEKPAISNGRFLLKKKGGWLNAISLPVQSIPNLFVMLELHARLTSPGGEAKSSFQPDMGMAQNTYY